MSLLIVIVNFRTPKLTVDCLRSLADKLGEVPEPVRVLVVENGSGDDSAAQIRSAIDANGWASWAAVRVEQKNWGFAGGNNRGLEALKDDPAIRYVLLLNSDTLVHPGTLGHCWRLMEADPTIGVMSCQLKNADGSVQNTCRKFPSPGLMSIYALGLPWKLPGMFGWADFDDPRWDRATVKRDVDWVGGAFMFMRADLVRRLGGLDEGFFFYGEDTELCLRYTRAGYRVHYDPAVSITHLGGASSDPTKVASRMRNVYAWQARYLLQRKCWGRGAAALIRAADVTAYGSRMAVMRLIGRRNTPEYANKRDVLSILLKPIEVAPPGGNA